MPNYSQCNYAKTEYELSECIRMARLYDNGGNEALQMYDCAQSLSLNIVMGVFGLVALLFAISVSQWFKKEFNIEGSLRDNPIVMLWNFASPIAVFAGVWFSIFMIGIELSKRMLC